MTDFEHDLARAATIPSSWYLDERILDREQDSIFAQTWQLVGRIDQLPESGSYLTGSIAKEPIVVVRGRDNQIRAFSAVCRHRAGPVASGEGKRASFQCGYHGWTYGLDGRLLTTSEFEGVDCFVKEDFSLPEFDLETWGPLIFVRIGDGGKSLKDSLGRIHDSIGNDRLRGYRFAMRKDWYVDCNWKVYVDNYLEGYHIPIVHPGLFRELDYANYRVETDELFSIQHSPIARPERLRVNNPSDEAGYFWVFPNLMLNVYPDNFSTNLIVPLGVDRTLTIFEWYFADPTSEENKRKLDETIAFSDEIQIEDIDICEAVQRGLASRTYDRGRYSVRRENGVHHFHGLLCRFLG